MDNKGGSIGEYSNIPENFVPNNEAPGFDEFLKSREDLRPDMEMPTDGGEQGDENGGDMARMNEMPMGMPPDMVSEGNVKTESGETPALTELKNIDIPRDAESLPKSYAAAIARVISADKRDPHKMVDDLDEARWDMLRKAYGRNLGDGLNGSGGDGSRSVN